jgi:hypothetical protein
MAIEGNCASALLLKVNQIGTLTEAAEALRLARQAGWHITVSARSGETEDHWLADLAVGWAADQIKVGSITQSERLAKYNRLLQIEGEIGSERVIEWWSRRTANRLRTPPLDHSTTPSLPRYFPPPAAAVLYSSRSLDSRSFIGPLSWPTTFSCSSAALAKFFLAA